MNSCRWRIKVSNMCIPALCTILLVAVLFALDHCRVWISIYLFSTLLLEVQGGGKNLIRLVINQTQKHFTVSEHVHLVIEHLTRMSNSPKLILTQFLFYVTIMKGMPSECSCMPMDSCYLTPSVGSNFLSGSLWAVLKVARCCRYLQLTQEALHFWRVLGVPSKLKVNFLVLGRWKGSDIMFSGQDPEQKMNGVNATTNSGECCLHGMVPWDASSGRPCI